MDWSGIRSPRQRGLHDFANSTGGSTSAPGPGVTAGKRVRNVPFLVVVVVPANGSWRCLTSMAPVGGAPTARAARRPVPGHWRSVLLGHRWTIEWTGARSADGGGFRSRSERSSVRGGSLLATLAKA